MEKSFISMSQYQCPICGDVFDGNELLLDRRLRNSMERVTLVGHKPCPNCQQKLDDGYVFLIECSEPPVGDWREAKRTGRTAQIRKTVADELFTTHPIETMAFVDTEVMDWLEEQSKKAA